MSNEKKIKVIELFAGVGGFRVGLERASKNYKVVWSNQWEPSSKTQHASDIYIKNFGFDGHSNEDISKVEIKKIPDHDLLVGGFPCQDYSVANSLSRAGGIQGVKGVLWWEIYRIIREKKVKPKALLLENVDRLIKSPANQRGKDFAIMLASLSDMGYVVEWRVINAADYGMPQRRKRTFILCYHSKTSICKKFLKAKKNDLLPNFFEKHSIINHALPCSKIKHDWNTIKIEGDLPTVSKDFNKKGGHSPFLNSGIMVERTVFTTEVEPKYKGKRQTLGQHLIPDNEVPDQYFITEDELRIWKEHKGAKKIERVDKATGYKYFFSEGAMSFPDDPNKPSRTIITSEGGKSPSRFKHVVKTGMGYRRLTPVELERLNMFKDNHTEGVSDVKRAFLMGNALVVGIVEKLGRELEKVL
jgi:DNA (cytosine-5)-methyltransferase 1